MGLILPRWGLIFPRSPPPTPLLYSAVTDPFRGCVHSKNTPKPPQNTPVPGLNFKVGKVNYCLGNLDPNWTKCLKSGQNFSRCRQKQFINYHFIAQFGSNFWGTAFQTWKRGLKKIIVHSFSSGPAKLRANFTPFQRI